VGFCLLAIRRGIQKLRIIQAQLAAYRRADYRAQLAIVEGLKVNGSESANYLFFHGAACYQLGRLQEAERAVRHSLAMETNPKLKTICRDELGRVLMARERWDEAEACFRVCIAEAPHRGGGHRAMAELLLRRGEQQRAALEAARSAVAADRAEVARRGELGEEANAINLSESLAFLAWALAENGASRSEIQGALDEAFALCGESTKPVLAELHFCAGQVYAAIGNAEESIRHFERATEVDPDGNYGRLSRSARAIVTPRN
jgi:tetratricopeptide (TPR) repeat protein